MPNHISNKLTLHCDPVKAVAILSEIGGPADGDGERLIDFDKLIPYPKPFAEADRACEQWRNANPDRPWSEGPDDGFNHGGYEWCLKSWGTKWNAYNQTRLSDTEVYFDTAWATPEPIFDLLATKYPNITFFVHYADEDIGRNAGILIYRHGKKTDSPAPEGPDAAKLWFQLNPESDPNEYGFDPKTFERLDEDEEAA